MQQSIWRTANYRLIGVSPLIFHNGQLANPLNNFSKEIKKISGKRNKTEADYEYMAKLEFLGGLYLNEKKEPIVPSEGIEAMIVAGAKKSKEGQVAKAAIYVPEHATLNYKGPKKAEKLWEDENFILMVGVKVQKNRIMRTRPIFKNWSFNTSVNYNIEMCNEDQIFNWLSVAGTQCGSFDWRPKYGRFEVERSGVDCTVLGCKGC